MLHGRSEKELMLATDELRALRKSHSQQFTVTAKKLADFLESVEAEEAMLAQRLCDAEGRKVLEKINGGASATQPEHHPVVKSAQRSKDTEAEDPSSQDPTILVMYNSGRSYATKDAGWP